MPQSGEFQLWSMRADRDNPTAYAGPRVCRRAKRSLVSRNGPVRGSIEIVNEARIEQLQTLAERCWRLSFLARQRWRQQMRE